MSRNWTGAPSPEPFELRYSIRRPLWPYRATHLTHAHLSLGKRIYGRTDRWWPSLHGTPIMSSVNTTPGPAMSAVWTTYDKTPPEYRHPLAPLQHPTDSGREPKEAT